MDDNKLRQSHCYVRNERCEEDLCNYTQVVDFYKELDMSLLYKLIILY